jgi:hypothetical protein
LRAGQAARGSGALGGYADILLEMSWFARPTDPDRRRVIEAYSRHEETPRRLVIELSPDGTDYLSLGDVYADDFAPHWQTLQALLASSAVPLTRVEIQRRWPPGAAKPDLATVWRWLERLVIQQKLERLGSGRKTDPFRFRLVPAAADPEAADDPEGVEEHSPGSRSDPG